MNLNFLPNVKKTTVFDKIIKTCLYLVTFLIPLWFLPWTTSILELNKQFLLFALMAVGSVAWLAKSLGEEEVKWQKSKLNWAIGTFFLIYVLATIFSIQPYDSLFGFPTHLSGGLLNVLSLVVFYFLVINNLRKKTDKKRLVLAFIISATIVALFGLLQLLGGFVLPISFLQSTTFNTIGTINSLGLFATISLVLVTAILLMKDDTFSKILLWVLWILDLILLLLINFWILWLVLAAGLLVLFVFHLSQRKNNMATITPLMAFLVLTLFMVIFRPNVSLLKPDLPLEVSLSYGSSFSITRQTLMDKPILGTGPETFIFNYGNYKPEGILQTNFWSTRFSNPASEIFSLATDTGLLGIIAFLVVIGLMAYLSVKQILTASDKSQWQIGLLATWLSLIVAWVIYPQNLTILFVAWLFLALLAVEVTSQTKKISFSASSGKALIVSLLFVALILLSLSLIYLEGARYLSEIEYRQGLDLAQNENNLDGATVKLIKSTQLNSHNDRAFQSLAPLFLAKTNQSLVDPNLTKDERQKKAELNASQAINSAVRATVLNPVELSNWLVRGDTYKSLVGFIKDAEKWSEVAYKQALGIEPTNPYIYTQIGRLYTTIADLIASSGQTDEAAKQKLTQALTTAQNNFDKAIEIKGDYSPAHFELALVYSREGRTKEAIAKMEANKTYSPDDLGVIFQLAVLYYKDSQFDKAEAEFRRALEIDPKFANARYFLGLIDERNGQIDEAIKEFTKIADLNPKNETVKQILENLKNGRPALSSPVQSGTLPSEK